MGLLEIMTAEVSLGNLIGFLIMETLVESLNYLFLGLTLMLMSSVKTESIILIHQNSMRSGILILPRYQVRVPFLHGIGHLDNSLQKDLTEKSPSRVPGFLLLLQTLAKILKTPQRPTSPGTQWPEKYMA